MVLSPKPLTALIREDDTSYISLLNSIVEDFQNRQFVPLLGAGISRDHPSNLPLANDLKEPLLSALHQVATLVRDNINATSEDFAKIKEVLEEARLERLLDAFYQTHGKVALEYLTVLNSKTWNANHAAIATLAENGRLPYCITLNFDLLIEEAVDGRKSACKTVCPLTNHEFQTGIGEPCMTIIKPHGSFAPASESINALDFLSATLTQVGSQPNPTSVAKIKEVFSKCTNLLVGGYSDDDWDIFPIIRRLSHQLKRIVWIQYIDEGSIPSSDNPDLASLFNRIIPWLKGSGLNAIVLFGRLDLFLNDLLSKLGLQALPPSKYGALSQLPENLPILSTDALEDPPTIKTALSLAMLLQHTPGKYSFSLLNWLRNLDVVQRTPDIFWRVEYLLAHTEHTRGNVYKAIPHMKKVIHLKLESKSNESVAADQIWLGYEYLSLTKRPNPLNLIPLFLTPIFLVRGLHLLNRAVSEASPADKTRFKYFAKYYRADLLHSWANVLMLFGPWVIPFLKPIFCLITHLYDSIEKRSALMKEYYYWMRHLEAKLLAGKITNRDRLEIEFMLNEIEQSNFLTQENVQIGNANAYRALLSYLLDRNANRAGRLLQEAEIQWRNLGDNIVSGHRRTILFRRLIGQISFVDAIVEYLYQNDGDRNNGN